MIESQSSVNDSQCWVLIFGILVYFVKRLRHSSIEIYSVLQRISFWHSLQVDRHIFRRVSFFLFLRRVNVGFFRFLFPLRQHIIMHPTGIERHRHILRYVLDSHFIFLFLP